jgi:hypothetical protein
MADVELGARVEQIRKRMLAAIAPTDSGVMNFCAAAVITTRTSMPRSRSRRIRSSDL